MALTAAAGPAANFITAFLAFAGYLAIGVYLLGTQVFALGVNGVYVLMTLLTSGQIAANGIAAFLLVLMIFLGYTAVLSVGLGVFNLIPVHPLDGSRVVDAFLPFSWSLKLQKYQSVILLLFVAAIWFGWLDGLMLMADSAVVNLAARFVGLFL